MLVDVSMSQIWITADHTIAIFDIRHSKMQTAKRAIQGKKRIQTNTHKEQKM